MRNNHTTKEPSQFMIKLKYLFHALWKAATRKVAASEHNGAYSMCSVDGDRPRVRKSNPLERGGHRCVRI